MPGWLVSRVALWSRLEHRRNLSNRSRIRLAETKRELIEEARPKGGGDHGNQYTGGKVAPGQDFDPVPPKNERSTDSKIDRWGSLCGPGPLVYADTRAP